MRRRRTKGTWLPNVGTAINEEETYQGRQFTLTLVAGPNNSATAISPLTFDVEFGEDADPSTTTSMADVIGRDYVLQRIVGKLFLERQVAASAGIDPSAAVLVGAGFFVARQNDSGSGGGVDTPIGSASAIERRDNYSVLDADNVREPWIWRRTWILGVGQQKSNVVAGLFEAGNYPCSNVYYGSVADGPHIDSKVKRRIGQDNRLWFGVSAMPYPAGAAVAANIVVRGNLDYRLFGSIRKARNSSAF